MDELMRAKSEILDLQAVLMHYNDLLRSALAIAERKGANTNWEPFEAKARELLRSHPEILERARDAVRR